MRLITAGLPVNARVSGACCDFSGKSGARNSLVTPENQSKHAVAGRTIRSAEPHPTKVYFIGISAGGLTLLTAGKEQRDDSVSVSGAGGV